MAERAVRTTSPFETTTASERFDSLGFFGCVFVNVRWQVAGGNSQRSTSSTTLLLRVFFALARASSYEKVANCAHVLQNHFH